MARARSAVTPVDLVVTALSPALIVGVIVSLVFFMAEVLYGGQYESRLTWTLFFLVVGMVLVGRIAIVVDRTRAAGYGLVLAVVGYIALQVFVQYPADSPVGSLNFLINGALIGVIWWCALKLVTDCTSIDDARPSSDRGLLAVLGLETPNYVRTGAPSVRDEPPRTDGSLRTRYRRFKARNSKKPHTPGTSVIWFALAALPIFGFGQSLIPPDADARRSWTFQLAAIYVTSSLGLLLTTSFLGLRRYLRQRGLTMPAKITRSWLGLGSVLVVSFVAVAAILPRPYSETPLIRISKAGSADRKASDNSVLNDGAGKGEGRKGNETEAGDGKATAKGGKPGGQGKNAGDKGKGGGAKEGKAGDGKDGEKDGGPKGEAKDSQEGKKGEPEAKSGEKSPEKAGDKREAGDRKQSERDGDRLQDFQSGTIGKAFSGLLNVLKWALFLAVLIVVLAAIVRNGLKWLANFMPWAQRLLDSLSAFWAGLFGRKPTAAIDSRSEAVEGVAHRPFSDFRDPFETGLADDIGLARSIEYSFEALEAWAADSDVPRVESETPLEFAARLMRSHPQTEPGAGQLSQLLVRVAYSGGELPADARKLLRDFWNRLEPPVA